MSEVMRATLLGVTLLIGFFLLWQGFRWYICVDAHCTPAVRCAASEHPEACVENRRDCIARCSPLR